METMNTSYLNRNIAVLAAAVISLAALEARPVRGENGTKPAFVIKVERIVSFTGRLRVTLPSGKVKKLTAGQEFLEFPAGTLIQVVSGECTTLLAVNKIKLPTGATARIIKPLVRGSKITGFSGRIKVILPSGEEIIFRAGQTLPMLPPHSTIIVLSGEASIDSAGDQVTLTEGETGEIDSTAAEENMPADIIDLAPVSK